MKVKVAIPGSPSLIVCRVSVDVKQHWTWIDLGLVCFSAAVDQHYCILIWSDIHTGTQEVETVLQTCVMILWKAVTNTIYTATHTHTHTKWRQCHKPVWGFCGGRSPTQCTQIHAHTDTQSEDSVTNPCDDSVEDSHRHKSYNVYSYTHWHTHTHMKWRKCHKPVWWFCGGQSPTQCTQIHAHIDTQSEQCHKPMRWFCGGRSPTPGDTWVVSGCLDTLSAHRCCAEWCGNTTQNSRRKGLGPDPQRLELWKMSCCLGAGWTVESEKIIIGTCTQKVHSAQNN